MPPKLMTKATADVTFPDDLLTDPIITLVPAGEDTGTKGSADTVNMTTSMATDNVAAKEKAKVTGDTAVEVMDNVAGSSGLTVEEKSQANQAYQAPLAAIDDFLEDDSDEELDIDIAKEDAFRLRFTTILLIPMVLSQETKALIAAVRLQMTKSHVFEYQKSNAPAIKCI
ncbi:unnamed protein product [Closterium sp. NIES-65]|nr:unnamed protein product [Closterium sp. NIES-65]